MSTLLSIKKIYNKHRAENPDSILSERAIREAVKNGTLPAVCAGRKKLVCLDTFENWIRGK